MNDQVKYYTKNNLYTHLMMNGIERAIHLSEDELIAEYEKRFLKVFQRAFQFSKFYQTIYKKAGIHLNDIKSLEDIVKLPVINRPMIQDQEDEIYNGPKWGKTKGLTSGTSGTPLTIHRHFFDVCTEQAYVRHYRTKNGFKKGQPLLSLRGVLGKSEPYYYFKPGNILYVSIPNLNKDTIKMYHDLITKFNPVAVEAFPSYLHKFCLELESANLAMQIPLAFTSSETLLSWQRENIEHKLNCKLFDWYGNAERSILLAQDDQGTYKPAPLYSINEFEKDHIITTALTHNNFPLIRYQVNDTVQVSSHDFLKNLVNPEIIKIEGRASDNIILKDGSLVGCIDHAFKGVSHLEMAQVHQYNVDQPIIIKLITKPGFSDQEEQLLISNWRRMVGYEMELSIEKCQKEDLTHVPGKKFQLIIKQDPKFTAQK